MKKIKYLWLVLFLIGSIYYTNQSIMYSRKKDPIMIQIEESKRKYEIRPVNALIQEDYIIPGLNGITIDIEKTYHQMKQYGAYNESLTVLKEQKPDRSLNNHYNKYIENGNPEKRKVSLVLKASSDLDLMIRYLEQNHVVGTFFIDGSLLEIEYAYIKNHKNHEYEILSYENKYNTAYLKTSISYLQSITKQKVRFCYNETKNKKFFHFCTKEKLYTIVPKKIYNENLYYQVKQQIENGDIIVIDWNKEIEKEFSSTIQYIKSKGYEIVTLKELLDEKKE